MEKKDKRCCGVQGREVVLVVASGAADISEGAVHVSVDRCSQKPDDDNARKQAAMACAKSPGRGVEPTEYAYSTVRKPGDGFWAVAPGCADISEGMVWVTKSK
jgi:hypothetical protein